LRTEARTGEAMHRRTAARVATATAVCLLGCALAPEGALAQASPTTGRTPVADLAGVWAGASVGLLGLGVGLFLAPTSRPADPSVGVWRGGLLLDEGFRDALHAPSPRGELTARLASDVLLVGTMANAMLVDGLLIPLANGDPHLAWQASFAYSLAVGLMLGVGGVAKRVAVRARPFERACALDPSASGCQSSDAYQSFFSLHTGLAFTSAGFSCAMHLERSLYGDQPADIVSCGSSLSAATLVGLLRVVADVHYLSDVAIGAALGFLIGYLVPLAVVPHRARATDGSGGAAPDLDALDDIPVAAPSGTWAMTPMLDLGSSSGGTTIGASVSGTF
jgi:membrane-associated phospholipid phosphatase